MVFDFFVVEYDQFAFHFSERVFWHEISQSNITILIKNLKKTLVIFTKILFVDTLEKNCFEIIKIL